VLTGSEILEGCPAELPFPVEEVIAGLEPFATPQRRARIEQVLATRLASVTLVVDALHDPHNGAALVRSCDAFGVQDMHAIERTEALSISRTVSRGTQKWVDVHRWSSGAECAQSLAASGHELIATHPEGELLPEDLATIPRVALLMGNEREGIDPNLRAACTRAVRVPMVGMVESLNVSVTAAILLYAATRRRSGDVAPDALRALYARALYRTVQRPYDHIVASQSTAPSASASASPSQARPR
jgi:tRNA (guanosine-2'-O-)-methyltransferase